MKRKIAQARLVKKLVVREREETKKKKLVSMKRKMMKMP